MPKLEWILKDPMRCDGCPLMVISDNDSDYCIYIKWNIYPEDGEPRLQTCINELGE